MNTLVRNTVLWLAGAVLMIGATVASAQTATANFQVQANVNTNCQVSANNLVFGTYDPTAADRDVNTTLSVRCTNGTPFTVALNAGVTTGSTLATRLMAFGTNYMQYNLYTTGARTTIFGDGTGGTGTVGGTGAGMGAGNAVTVTVYGRIPTAQYTLPVGAYAESQITATVTY